MSKFVIDDEKLILEWDWEKNNELKMNPHTITLGNSILKPWWKCSICGHEWQARVYNRSKGVGCPNCAKKRVWEQRYKRELEEQGSVESNHPELLEEWDYERNEKLPSQYICGSHEKVWWKCNVCGESYLQTVDFHVNRGQRCPKHIFEKMTSTKSEILLKKGNSLGILYPELLEEWDYEKNEKNPYMIGAGSSYKPFWKCKKCGLSWQTTVYHRTTRNSGCPYCANKKVDRRKSFGVIHPNLLELWDFEKNDISPYEVTSGSSKDVWWICEKGHSYLNEVVSVVHGKKCPICLNQKVLAGYNDLATTNPEMLEEWDYEKNTDIKPSELTAGSNRKVWWYCNHGHSYLMKPNAKKQGNGCPRCAAERKTSFPEQAVLFYLSNYVKVESRYYFHNKYEIDVFLPELNIGIEYDGLYYHSGKEAALKEEKKNKYLSENNIRLIRIKETEDIIDDANDIIYVFSSHKKINLDAAIGRLISLLNFDDKPDINTTRDSAAILSNYVIIEKQNSLMNVYPTVISQWDYEKNGRLKPDMVSAHSKRTVWWKCPTCNNSYTMSIDSRTKNINSNCPYCLGQRHLVGFNDLETKRPDLMIEWDYEKNIQAPSHYQVGSRDKVWWKCPICGNSYESRISNRVNGKKCPKCSINIRADKRHEAALNKTGSLKETHPKLIEEWDYEKNIVLPEEITLGSSVKVWWKCSKGHQYQSRPNNRVRGKGCPICSNQKVITGINDIATTHPLLALEWDYENNVLDIKTISAGTHRKAWWICPTCGRHYEASIKSRSDGTGCIVCNGGGNKPFVMMDENRNVLERFESLMDAVNKTGLSKKVIWTRLKNKKSINGFYFEYL